MISITKLFDNSKITLPINERYLDATLGQQNYRKVNPPRVSLANAPLGLMNKSAPSRNPRNPSLAAARMGVNKK